MLNRRTLLTGLSSAALLAPAFGRRAHASDLPGVTDTEIRIGSTMPFSGPISRYGTVGRVEEAYFKMINEQGGVNGRAIKLISYDDAASPPKTVEQVRRLVESDDVALMFSMIGTASNTAVLKYLNQREVPHLFVLTGADKWSHYEETPWTIGWQPSYRVEAAIYAKYIKAEKPNGKIGIIYQNDDFGKDYLTGFQEGLGSDVELVTASYDPTDPTVDSQVLTLQQAGVDVLFNSASAKWAAMVIRKVSDLNWKPLHIMSNVSTSVGAVMEPAGVERGIGIVSSTFFKDPTDPAWNDDEGMNEWRAFMQKYYPDGDLKDSNNVWGYSLAHSLVHVLNACGSDLSRANIMKSMTSLSNVENPVLLPGITLNTSPTDYRPLSQIQMMKWTGTTWERFGDIIGT